MKIEKTDQGARLTLSAEELKLLRRALERASYIDTPVEEQERILRFCELALDALAGG